MTHDEVDRICDKLARAAKDARAKHKRNAELFGVGGSHQTQTWRLTTEAATLIRRLRDERDEARNKALDEAETAILQALPTIPCSCSEIVKETILALKTQEPKP